MKAYAVFVKEAKVYFSDKSTLVQLFLIPMLIITLANFAMQKIYTSESTIHIPVVDLDNSHASRMVLAEIKNARVIKLEETLVQGGQTRPMTEADAIQLIAVKHARSAAIIIPKGFEANLLSRVPAEIRVLENPLEKMDPMVANHVARLSTSRLRLLEQPGSAGKGLSGQGPAAGQPQLVWENPIVAVKIENALGKDNLKMNSLKQNVPGFAIMFALFSLVWVSMSIVVERETGTFARMLTAPISKFEILSGKLLMMFTMTCVQLGFFFAFGHFVFGMELGNSILGLIVLSMALAFTTTSLGVFFASFAKNPMQLGAIASIMVLGMSALGGSWWPLEFMPDIMQTVAHCVTINAWAMDGYKNLLWYGQGFTSILPQAGLLTGFSLVAFLLGLWKFRFV